MQLPCTRAPCRPLSSGRLRWQPPNKRLKLAAHVDYGMSLLSARPLGGAYYSSACPAFNLRRGFQHKSV